MANKKMIPEPKAAAGKAKTKGKTVAVEKAVKRCSGKEAKNNAGGRQSVTEAPIMVHAERAPGNDFLEVVDAHRVRQEKIWKINMASNESTIRAEAMVREDALRAQLEEVKDRTRHKKEALRLENKEKEEEGNRKFAAYCASSDQAEAELKMQIIALVAKTVGAEAELRVYRTAGLMAELCSNREKLLSLEMRPRPQTSPADSSTTASSHNDVQQESYPVAEPPSPTRAMVETRRPRTGSMHAGGMWNLPPVRRVRIDEDEDEKPETESDRSTNRTRIIGCEHELATSTRSLNRGKSLKRRTASRELLRRVSR